MSPLYRLLGVLFVVGLGGCSTTQISTDHDPSASFSDLKTYAWMPRAPRDPALSGINEKFVQARVQAAVDTILAGKGYKKRPSGDADFLVRYYAALRTEMNVKTDYYAYGRGDLSGRYHPAVASGSARTYVQEFKKGSLILDFVDSRTNRLIWRGSAQTVVNLTWSEEKRTAKINEAVQRMLKRFPPK